MNNDVVFLRRDESTHGKTEVVLRNGNIISVDTDPDKLLNQTLILLGSNMKARRTTAKKVHKIKQFIPIVIDSEMGIAFFPLHKQTDYCRYYINSNYFYDYVDEQIVFTNNAILLSSLPESFVRRQYERALSMVDYQKKIREQKIKYDY